MSGIQWLEVIAGQCPLFGVEYQIIISLKYESKDMYGNDISIEKSEICKAHFFSSWWSKQRGKTRLYNQFHNTCRFGESHLKRITFKFLKNYNGENHS